MYYLENSSGHVGHLIQLLSEAQDADEGDGDEGLWLVLLFEEVPQLPDNFLNKLRLQPDHVGSLTPPSLLVLAEQTGSAGRGCDGARTHDILTCGSRYRPLEMPEIHCAAAAVALVIA